MESAIYSNLIRSQSNRQSSRIQTDAYLERDPLLSLNEELDNLKLPHLINERSIEGFLKILEDSCPFDQSVYWLMTARIFELALFCAGHYADSCELSAAGDLLVNPRKILIHRKGYPDSFVKQRHGRISEQLKNGGRRREHLMRFLKYEVILEIVKPAILPYLFERMKHGQRIAGWYLRDAEERMKKVSDTIGFLSAWSVSEFEDLHHRLREASPDTRRFVGDHLCRFDTRYFEQLGREIHRLIKNSKKPCDFVAFHSTPWKNLLYLKGGT